MPYIDSTPALSPYKIREGDLQGGFKDILIKNGWTLAREFKKAVTSTHFVTEHDETARHDDDFVVAKHQILRNARGDLLGVAVVAEWSDFTDHSNGFPFYNWFTSDETKKEALLDYLEKEFEKRKTNTSLYFYMLDKLPNMKDGSVILTPWSDESKEDERLRMALDVEVTVIDFKDTTAASAFVKVANITVMQSPIVESSLRAKFLENVDYPYMDTNWWADSEVSIKGHIDSNNIFITIQTDNTPMWENNTIPIVPLYFGDIVPLDEGDPAIVLFAGTVPNGETSDKVATFDYSDITTKGGRKLMPILKKYPAYPSNGIDSVMVNRTKLGARYQNYFLSFNTVSQEMPPARKSDDQAIGDGDKQYPRSWEGIKKYQFNPSRYSGKVQTSRIYLLHPEEGNRGYLKRSVGLNSANLNASELRIRKEDCPEKVFDVYQCVPVSSVSPLTKRPSTHFNPMGLGIYKEELNPAAVTNPASVNDTEPASVTNLSYTKLSDNKFNLTWENPHDENFDSVTIYLNGEVFVFGVREVSAYCLEGLKETPTEIEVVAVSKTGKKSKVVKLTLQ
ncbi:hypothetical protein [Bacillus chungangensis]|uniref:Major virion structural protein n=1 Tax=Bacillus chungangensis TaxID=587633 RepID=A0ABT9WSN8_9BACI|nr:hypothetical protein [Bacillus chungangensis]MDQ0176225.1 hypothetical protein [Bacillus chungangensis]